MTVVLDSGGVSALAADRALVDSMRRSGQWPPVVSTAVLAESLTGDHRRDFHANRLLRLCTVRPVSEIIARHAAALRFLSGAGGISAVDAIVAATADHAGGGVVWTSDPGDLTVLARHTVSRVSVAKI